MEYNRIEDHPIVAYNSNNFLSIIQEYNPSTCVTPTFWGLPGTDYDEFVGEPDLADQLAADKYYGHMIIGVTGIKHAGKTTLIQTLCKMLGYCIVPDKGTVRETLETTRYVVNASLLQYTFVEFVGDTESVKNQIRNVEKYLDLLIVVVGEHVYDSPEISNQQRLVILNDIIANTTMAFSNDIDLPYYRMRSIRANTTQATRTQKAIQIYCNINQYIYADENLRALTTMELQEKIDRVQETNPYPYWIAGTLAAAAQKLPEWNMETIEKGLNLGPMLWAIRDFIKDETSLEIQKTLETYQPLIDDMNRKKNLRDKKKMVKDLQEKVDIRKNECDRLKKEISETRGMFSGGKKKKLEEELNEKVQSIRSAQSSLMYSQQEVEKLSVRASGLEEPYYRSGVLCYQSGIYDWAKQTFTEAGDYKNVRDYMRYLNILEKEYNNWRKGIDDYETDSDPWNDLY